MTDGLRIAPDSTIDAIAREYAGYRDMCESPAEDNMFVVLVSAALAVQLDGPVPITIWPQCGVPNRADMRYRLDFLVRVGDGERALEFAVEVDGLEFHGDQKAFAKDRRRDRELAQVGIETFRFTAAEAGNRQQAWRDVIGILVRFADRYPGPSA